MTSHFNQADRPDQQHEQSGSPGQQGSAPSRTGRGFAGMDRERQREIASQGGRAAHASGNAHQFTSEEARAAGSKRHANRAAAAAQNRNPGSDNSLS